MKKLLFIAAATAAVFTVRATPILVGSETSLQAILNSTVIGASVNVNTQQVASDAYWTAQANPSAYLIIEIAGYAGSNAFGIYQQGSPGNKIQVFAGSASGPSGPAAIAVPLGWGAFGFYLSNPDVGFTWYSDNSLNAGGGLDHFVAFQGSTGAHLNAANSNANFGVNDYIFGIEDLNLGDQDYNDMVVLVQNVNQVPDGGMTLALLGLGLASLVSIRRRLR